MYERSVFNSCDQKEGESIDTYVGELRTLAQSCNFCTCLHDTLIRDRIVLGLRDRSNANLLPSRRAIFLNSNFLHMIPFINFTSQFICNPRGVFIGDPFPSGACLSIISINKFFQTSHITCGFVSEKFYAMAVVQHRRGNGGG